MGIIPIKQSVKNSNKQVIPICSVHKQRTEGLIQSTKQYKRQNLLQCTKKTSAVVGLNERVSTRANGQQRDRNILLRSEVINDQEVMQTKIETKVYTQVPFLSNFRSSSKTVQGIFLALFISHCADPNETLMPTKTKK